MSYMGEQPIFGYYPSQLLSGDGSTTSFTLTYSPASSTTLLVTISGVKQQAGAYTVTDTTIDFGAGNAPPSGTNNIEILYLGQRSDVGTVADDSITTAKIADNNVTLAKLDDGTQGDVLYYGASGAPARLGFGTSGLFLKTQGTGANPVWAAPSSDMVLLDTVNADSGSSASFESKFDSTYNWYVMYWQLVPGTNAAETSVQFMSGSSVVAPGNKYEYSWNGTVMHTGAAVVGYGTGQNDVRFGNSTSNATFGQSGQAIIFDPNNNFAAGEFLNGRFQVTWRHGGNYYISAQGGFVFGVDQGNADGFYFAPTSGTWTYFDAQLYGVK